jgi:hypothetical protein
VLRRDGKKRKIYAEGAGDAEGKEKELHRGHRGGGTESTEGKIAERRDSE